MQLAIHLGSSTVRVQNGSGTLVEEPAMVALDVERHRVIGVGAQAEKMVGRTAPHIVPVHPIQNGVIAHPELTAAMLTAFLKRTLGWRQFSAPRVVVTVSPRSTTLDRRAFKEAATRAGTKDPVLIDTILAAALGAELDVLSPLGILVIHLGSDATEIALLSSGRQVWHETCAVGGNQFDRDVRDYVENVHDVTVDLRDAEMLKRTLGGAIEPLATLQSPDTEAEPEAQPAQVDLVGRDPRNGLPKSVCVTAREVHEALQPSLHHIADALKAVIERSTPELAADVAALGVVLTGGGALLPGIDEFLSRETGMSVRVADDPARCVLRGAWRARDYFKALRRRNAL